MSEQQAGGDSVETVDRVLVALDASPHSLLALKAAAELAALMQAELQGLFVEDINLVRICGLGFIREIGSYSAAARPMDTRSIEREFRMQAAKIRHEIAQTAVAANVRWTFRTTRGAVTSELLSAAQSAGMLTMGRVGRSMGKRFGSTTQTLIHKALHPVVILGDEGLSAPPIVLYDASPAAERALQLAVTLFRRRQEQEAQRLVLLVTPLQNESHAERQRRGRSMAAQLQSQGIQCRVVIFDSDTGVQADAKTPNEEQKAIGEAIVNLLEDLERGTLVLPAGWSDLLMNTTRSAVIIP